MNNYIKDLVLTNSLYYNNYFCYNLELDKVCVFSKNILDYENNYLHSANSKLCNISEDLTISCSYNNSFSTEIADTTEIYSNVGEHFPDFLADRRYNNSENIAFNVHLNDFYVVLVLLCLLSLIPFLKCFFRVKGRDIR